ncbi:MAG TPA: FG-GAP-like repeat-containing protein [Candidatus Kapabacteria bacterium]|nr:FG-GAP-like repeat-containing protein [Candidatus Kapabacteria bacterium]
MNHLLLPALVALLLCQSAAAQTPVELKRDAGSSAGQHARAGWEETVILSPNGPARIVELRVYHRGSVARRDTIHIVGDAAAGAIPPTSHVWSYNDLTEPIIVEYDGTPGWDTIDLRDRNLRTDGLDGIVIQHRIGSQGATAVGPYFGHDGSLSTPYASFLYDPVSTNELGFPGKYYLANGDLMVRAVVEYDYPEGNRSAPPPPPSLVDRTVAVGLTDGAGAPVKSSRVSVADWNGDGWDDVAIGSTFFENKGDGTFADVSTRIAITGAGASVWGDYDNDGDLDCYAVNGGSGDALWRNDGDGSFTSVKATAGIDNPRPTVTPIWLDYDRDGWLDLFIANGRTEGAGGEEYFRDALWRNNHDGTFSDASDASGIAAGEPPTPYDAWGASASDYDKDGFVDIHVATYRLAPDLLFHNNGNGTFGEVAFDVGVHGVATASDQYFGHGIGTEFGDYNNDTRPDLVVGNLGHPDWRGQVSNPTLVFRNDGATFTEVTRDLGIKFFEMNAGVVWLDLDLDGWLDLWHCHYAYNPPGASTGEPTRRSRMYLNGGASESFRFRDATWNLGSLIHGAWTAARGDFDRDGRMDLVVASPHDGVRLFHNEMKANGRFLALRIVGSPAAGVPADGIGTRMTVHAGGRTFYRELMGGGGGTTASQNSSLLHFGLGDVATIDSIVVGWGNGTSTTIAGAAVRINAMYELTYDGGLTEEATTGVGDDGECIPIDARRWSLVDARAIDGGILVGIDGDLASGARAEVVDALGRVAATGELDGGVLASEPLPAGVYIVRVTADAKSGSVRLVVR